MRKPRIRNRKSTYIPRSKIGAKNAEVQVAPAANRQCFKVQPDGYFIWRSVKKSET